MGRLNNLLKPGNRVALDTAVFIYHFEANPDYSVITAELFEGIESGRWQAVTSVITLMEIAVAPLKQGRDSVAEQYEALLVHFPNLSLVEVSRQVARRAAQLRAKYNLRPPDAIQAATALVHQADVLITNDHRLARLEPMMRTVMLGSLARE